MPRVTPSEHYKRYHFLRTAWLEFPKLYALLPLHAQWQVHEFYQPSKDITKAELTRHIRHLADTKPALVHQAGKHVRLMQRVFRHVSKELDIPRSEWGRAFSSVIQQVNPLSASSPPERNGQRYTISVAVRPKMDVKIFSSVLVELAESLSEAK